MQHTMRSAFKRWLILHNEPWRAKGYIRIPSWFRWYIRKNYVWEYHITDMICRNYYKIYGGDPRRFKGRYSFKITDEELINLQRPEWIK